MLHSFDGVHGAQPQGGLNRGTDGSFYGTTYGGGKYSAGTIFKITPDGTFTTLFDFHNGRVDPAPKGRPATDQEQLDANGSFPSSAPVQGSDGNLYGVTGIWNDGRNGVLYRITPTGDFHGLYFFKGDTDPTPLT